MAVLLLSATMQPLNVISKRRLLILLGKERIALLDDEAEAEAEAALRERRLPQGIVLARLLRAVHVPRRTLRPTLLSPARRRSIGLRSSHRQWRHVRNPVHPE